MSDSDALSRGAGPPVEMDQSRLFSTYLVAKTRLLVLSLLVLKPLQLL